jgi:hypothetical protein
MPGLPKEREGVTRIRRWYAIHDALVTCQTSQATRHNYAQIGGNPLQMRFVRSAQNLRYQHEKALDAAGQAR